MSISNTTNRVTYTGNGVTTAFAVSFPFHAQADLVVVETIIATGVQTVKALTTHYTISGVTDSLGHYPNGGTVNAVVAPASTVTWTIYRDPTLTQGVDLVEGDPLPVEADVESPLDRLTMIAQRNRDLISRSLRQPDGDSANIATMPAKVIRANKYLSFDLAGDPVAAGPLTLGVAPLTEIPGYTKAGLPVGGLAGLFARVTDSIRGLWLWTGSLWFSITHRHVNVQEFGCHPSNTAVANATAFQAAIDALPSQGGVIEVPSEEAEYQIDGTALNPGAKPVIIQGGGWKTLVQNVFGHANWTAAGAITGTVLKITGTQDGFVTNNATYRNMILRDLALLGPGSGASVGINSGIGAQNNELKTWNVLIANFNTGLRLNDAITSFHSKLTVWGCTTGIDFLGSCADHHFVKPDVQSCTTGWKFQSVTSVHLYGGLCQNNTTGMLWKPNIAGGINVFNLNGVWFENNTNPIAFDTTTGPIGRLKFIACRGSESATITPIIVAGVINNLSFDSCDFGGWTFAWVENVQEFLSENTKWADITGLADSNRVTLRGFGGANISADLGKTITYAASVTPNWKDGEFQEITLTGNVTINNPSNMPRKGKLTLIIRQDGTGGRTVAWGGGYHHGWSDTGNTANKYSTIMFYNVGSGGFQGVQVGAQGPYIA